MVELGRTHGPLDLRKAGVQVRNRLDTDGPEPDERKAYDRESLTLKATDQGVDFRGYLANENAELLRTLIHAHAKPHKTIDGALDPRPRSKRQADALTTLLTTANNPTATATAATGPAAGSAGTAAGAGAAGSPDTGADTGAAADDLAGTLPGISTDTDPAAPAPRARRLLRQPGRRPRPPAVPPVRRPGPPAARPVPDGPAGSFPGMDRRRTSPSPSTSTTSKPPPPTNSATSSTATPCPRPPSDASRATRRSCPSCSARTPNPSTSAPPSDSPPARSATPSSPATKAACCCGAPPIYCDAHHVVHWIDGGATKLTNLALLCKRCHRDLHAGHWTIQITHGIVHVTRPTWATPDPVPRGRYRPPTTTPGSASGPTTRGAASATPHGSTMGGAADATTRGGAGGGSTRAWPRETDLPWITPEDAARLNPWGDAPDERPTRRQKLPPAADFDPWGDAPDERPSRRQPRPPAADLDPWGDAPDVQPSRRPTRPPATDFDPWGERSDDEPAGVPKESAGAGIDPSGDGGNTTANADRPSKLGMNNSDAFDPWREATTPRSGGVDDLADARMQRPALHSLFTPDTGLAS